MKNLLTLSKLKINHKHRARTAFYASDYDKPELDLFFSFTGVEKTNEAQWNETLKWGAGVGVEAQMLKVLQDSNVVPLEYDQKIHGRVDIERAGVVIHGYVDASTALDDTGIPIEIKSFNNKNFVNIKELRAGFPSIRHVGQLAVYMDARNKDEGYLFCSTVDGLDFFLFKCRRLRNGTFRCGKVKLDLDEWYAKLYHLKVDHIDKNKMPDIWQYRYKYDVNTIDWRNVSKNAIVKARNNRKVIGDWQVQWSDWKDLIIKLQKEKKGYSNKELEVILTATKGYSTWGKNLKDV